MGLRTGDPSSSTRDFFYFFVIGFYFRVFMQCNENANILYFECGLNGDKAVAPND